MSHPSLRINAGRRPPRRCQRGVAAVEFALVSMALLLSLHIIATFGLLLHTQQVLSRSASDGALVISSSSRNVPLDEVTRTVLGSLTGSLVKPLGFDEQQEEDEEDDEDPSAVGYRQKEEWVKKNVTVHVSADTSANAGMVLEVRYPYAQNAVLPALPGMNFLVPPELKARAVVAVGP